MPSYLLSKRLIKVAVSGVLLKNKWGGSNVYDQNPGNEVLTIFN